MKSNNNHILPPQIRTEEKNSHIISYKGVELKEWEQEKSELRVPAKMWEFACFASLEHCLTRCGEWVDLWFLFSFVRWWKERECATFWDENSDATAPQWKILSFVFARADIFLFFLPAASYRNGIFCNNNNKSPDSSTLWTSVRYICRLWKMMRKQIVSKQKWWIFREFTSAMRHDNVETKRKIRRHSLSSNAI